MTETETRPIADTRPIAEASPLYNARLARRVDLTESLAFFWVAFDGPAVDFLPGQYFTIGVESAGRLVQRPYSVASSPREAATGYELYIRLVPDGEFTPLLWRCGAGQLMSLKGAKGRFVLGPDDGRTLLFVSSGTGVAPFVSMIRTLKMDGTPRRAIVLHGASYARELGYRDELESYGRDGSYPVTYVSTISRPAAPENAGWDGRTGRVEAIVAPVCDELGLTAENTTAYVCGNPDMIENVEALLLGRGFPEAQVKKELYWPKGKGPRRAAQPATQPAAS